MDGKVNANKFLKEYNQFWKKIDYSLYNDFEKIFRHVFNFNYVIY